MDPIKKARTTPTSHESGNKKQPTLTNNAATESAPETDGKPIMVLANAVRALIHMRIRYLPKRKGTEIIDFEQNLEQFDSRVFRIRTRHATIGNKAEQREGREEEISEDEFQAWCKAVGALIK